MRSDALKQAQKKYMRHLREDEDYILKTKVYMQEYYDKKLRHDTEYMERQKEYSRQYYRKNRDRVLHRLAEQRGGQTMEEREIRKELKKIGMTPCVDAP